MHLTPDELIRALQGSSLRITKARRAICEVLATSHQEHMSATDILERAREQAGVGIDQSTVYRTLDVLEELGYLHHVHLGHRASGQASHPGPALSAGPTFPSDGPAQG